MPDTSALRSAFDVLAAGRQVQGGRIRTISENLANADS
ncbi:MAG: flagellar biosynthesis protein FlgC, partial [Actinomycetospora chiangmaiensis]|nr:flagellar biosynthesis protein FlgC [Actinomycetospora chiangmaiensis]